MFVGQCRLRFRERLPGLANVARRVHYAVPRLILGS
jgi:hypothetical protein